MFIRAVASASFSCPEEWNEVLHKLLQALFGKIRISVLNDKVTGVLDY